MYDNRQDIEKDSTTTAVELARRSKYWAFERELNGLMSAVTSGGRIAYSSRSLGPIPVDLRALADIMKNLCRMTGIFFIAAVITSPRDAVCNRSWPASTHSLNQHKKS
jgi:hypothetical protein